MRLTRRFALILIFMVLPTYAYAGHIAWTEGEPSHSITVEEARELLGFPAGKVKVLWSVDYAAEAYPAVVTIRAGGTDGLTLYVFRFAGDGWELLAEGVGPEIQATVEAGGSLSLAVRLTEQVAEEEPANKGENTTLWVSVGAIVALAAIFAVLARKRHKAP